MLSDRRAFLDRPIARVIAALIVLLCGALLAYIHRHDVRTLTGAEQLPASDAAASDDPATACIEARFSEIDGMVEDGVVGEEQAAMFKQRAEAMCRATEGGGGGPPLPLPVE